MDKEVIARELKPKIKSGPLNEESGDVELDQPKIVYENIPNNKTNANRPGIETNTINISTNQEILNNSDNINNRILFKRGRINEEDNEINSPPKGWKFCLIYILIFFSLFIFFFVNFLQTIHAFDGNLNFSMSPSIICAELIKDHNNCLNEYRNISLSKEIIEECASSSEKLQRCYDEIHIYNRKCYIYLSEFERCFRMNKKEEMNSGNVLADIREKCKEEAESIRICTSQFRRIDPFILMINNN